MTFAPFSTKEILDSFRPAHRQELARIYQEVSMAFAENCQWQEQRPDEATLEAREFWRNAQLKRMAILNELKPDFCQLAENGQPVEDL